MPSVEAGAEGEGKFASMPEGSIGQMAATEHAIQSQGGGAPPGAGGTSLPPAPGGMPQGPANPPPQPPPQNGHTGSLNMNAVFSPQIAQRMNPSDPWRQQLTAAAESHPDAGSYLRRIASQIKGQRGPLR